MKLRNSILVQISLLFGFALQYGHAVAAVPPPVWAYPVDPPASGSAAPGSDTLRTVPDSRRRYTNAQVDDLFLAPDWHPTDHPRPPAVVLHGRAPYVQACGVCHRITGSGGPENADLAGLDYSYILQQLDDYRRGLRSTMLPSRDPQALMIALSQSLTQADARAAARYFSSLKPLRRIHVVEAALVPQTHVEGWRLAADDGSAREPIGQRIVELPDRPQDFESRDSRATFTAYAPPGSLAAGQELVRQNLASGALSCISCHGPQLRGSGSAPPLAGRSPTYLVRQLIDIQNSARGGSAVQLMKPALAALTLDQMITIAAYAASLQP